MFHIIRNVHLSWETPRQIEIESPYVVSIIFVTSVEKFQVPSGVCVTTAAYDEFIATPIIGEALEELEDFVGSHPSLKQLRQVCDR